MMTFQRWLGVAVMLLAVQATNEATAQVESVHSDFDPAAESPPSGIWTAQDEQIMDDLVRTGSGVLDAGNPFFSHGGFGEYLNQRWTSHYENLGKGMDDLGNPIPGVGWGKAFSGANKSGQWQAFKAQCTERAKKLKRLGTAITFADSFLKIAGHAAELDFGGTMITTVDEGAKWLTLNFAALGGTALTGGPWGGVAGAAAAEEVWAETGHKYFESEKQRLKNLQAIEKYAAPRITDPDIQAYMRGDIDASQITKIMRAKRQKFVDQWREWAELYPEIQSDVDALIELKSTRTQRVKLSCFRKLVKAVENDQDLHDAMKAWLAGDATVTDLNMLRKALGLKLLVEVDPQELAGNWSGGTFVITDIPLAEVFKFVPTPGAGAPADPSAQLQGCDFLPPAVLAAIPQLLERLRGEPMDLAFDVSDDGEAATVKFYITPPQGVEAAQSKPISLPYRFVPNTLVVEGVTDEGNAYLRFEGKVSALADQIFLRGTWELRGASENDPQTPGEVMLKGGWSGHKPR